MNIIDTFKKIDTDHSWAFADKSRKETAYITHGYHRYPAKFIPQIISPLIKKYTREGGLVVDPFGGCGTTLVESKVLGRRSLGTDINPVAVFITKSKVTPIEPRKLSKTFVSLEKEINNYDPKTETKVPEHERIDYWFKIEEKKKLAFLLDKISKIRNTEIKRFFYCGLSNILKNSSIWLQKSNKPTRDFNKKIVDPFLTFNRQINKMMRGNLDFFLLLGVRNFSDVSCDIYASDAREIPVGNNSANLIITSPPYVTSYEYADLHQLSALWFEYMDNLNEFRKKFIGTAYHNKKELGSNSKIAKKIGEDLFQKSEKKAGEVMNYFGEMNQVFQEMKRILKRGGRTCIVIGNTAIKDVKILNAEVFTEQLQNLGFKIEKIIKREIPSKNLPSIRDKKTGRFAKITNKNKTLAYPTEYILIMKKI